VIGTRSSPETRDSSARHHVEHVTGLTVEIDRAGLSKGHTLPSTALSPVQCRKRTLASPALFPVCSAGACRIDSF
jgi:hypothetical protein